MYRKCQELHIFIKVSQCIGSAKNYANRYGRTPCFRSASGVVRRARTPSATAPPERSLRNGWGTSERRREPRQHADAAADDAEPHDGAEVSIYQRQPL